MTQLLTREETRQLIHDLRGPLLSIEGFAEELSITTDSLFAALKRYESQLPDELVLEFGEMLSGDLAPCLHFLKSATALAESRLDLALNEEEVLPTGNVEVRQSQVL